MKKLLHFLKDCVLGFGVILLFLLFCVVTPVVFFFYWVFRIPYIFFRGTNEICKTFWKGLTTAYEEKKRVRAMVRKTIN